MCGIVGVVSNRTLTKQEKDVFQQLLMVDSVRGHHATGVMSVTAAGTVDVFKRAVNSQEFHEYKRSDTVLSGACIAVGHNRWATTGSSSDHSGAHPFEHGHITGVHNGTLDNQYDLKDHREFEVDSDNLYYSMAAIGEIETIEKLVGAFTLVWHNDSDKTINFVRNEERPLAIAFAAGVMYYASEAKMLDWILSRKKVLNYTIVELPVGEVWSLSVGTAPTKAAFGVAKVKLQDRWAGYPTTVGKRPVTGTGTIHGLTNGTDVTFVVDSIVSAGRNMNAFGVATTLSGRKIRAQAYAVPLTTMKGDKFLARTSYQAGQNIVLRELAVVKPDPVTLQVCAFCDGTLRADEKPATIASAPNSILHAECAAILEDEDMSDELKDITVQ